MFIVDIWTCAYLSLHEYSCHTTFHKSFSGGHATHQRGNSDPLDLPALNSLADTSWTRPTYPNRSLAPQITCQTCANRMLSSALERSHHHHIHLLTSLSAPSLARPTRSPVVPSSRLVCTYIYQATECELAPLMSQISNVHPATLS